MRHSLSSAQRRWCSILLVLLLGWGAELHVAHARKIFTSLGISADLTIKSDLPLYDVAPPTLKRTPTFKSQRPLYGYFELAGKRIHVAVAGMGYPKSPFYESVVADTNLNDDLSDDVIRPGREICSVNLEIAGQRVPYYFTLLAAPVRPIRNAPPSDHLTEQGFKVISNAAWTGLAELDGKFVQITIWDRSGNGYFNDIGVVGKDGRFTSGDGMLLRPTNAPEAIISSRSLARYFWFDEGIYKLEVHPSGNAIWIEPVTKTLGGVRCPYYRTTLSLWSKDGFFVVSTDKGTMPLPPGEYQISRMSVAKVVEKVIWTATVFSPVPPPLSDTTSINEGEPGSSSLLPSLVIRPGVTSDLPALSTLRVQPKFKTTYNNGILCSVLLKDKEDRVVNLEVAPVDQKETIVVKGSRSAPDYPIYIEGISYSVTDLGGKEVIQFTTRPTHRSSDTSMLLSGSALRELAEQKRVPLTVSVRMNTGPFPAEPIPPLKIEVKVEGAKPSWTVVESESPPILQSR